MVDVIVRREKELDFARHGVDLSDSGNGHFLPAVFLKSLNQFLENRSRLHWRETSRTTPFSQAPYSPL